MSSPLCIISQPPIAYRGMTSHHEWAWTDPKMDMNGSKNGYGWPWTDPKIDMNDHQQIQKWTWTTMNNLKIDMNDHERIMNDHEHRTGIGWAHGGLARATWGLLKPGRHLFFSKTAPSSFNCCLMCSLFVFNIIAMSMSNVWFMQ